MMPYAAVAWTSSAIISLLTVIEGVVPASKTLLPLGGSALAQCAAVIIVTYVVIGMGHFIYCFLDGTRK